MNEQRRVHAGGVATSVSTWQAALRAVLATGLALVVSAAGALEVQYSGQSRAVHPNYYADGSGGLQPMLPPGDVVLIDDSFHNTTFSFRGAVKGDTLGIQATDPEGTVSGNTVIHAGDCWSSGLVNYCPAWSDATWWMGTRVSFRPVGTWRVNVLNNGLTVHTFQFQLRPYTLDLYSQATQSAATRAVTAQALAVRLTRPDGAPGGAGKEVSFVLAGKPGGANPPGGFTSSATYTGAGTAQVTVQTDGDGIARTFFETGGKAGNYSIAVTARTAPGTTKTFTVTASGADALDAAVPEKNLGLDPADNSSCAAATSARTGNPIQVATGNKVAEEIDYEGAGAFPLRIVRYYNSQGARAAALGAQWRGFYDRNLVITSTTANGKTTTVAEAVRPDGRVLRYTLARGVWQGEPDVLDRLESIGGGYRFTCGNDQVELYNSEGRLGSVALREGFAQTLFYDVEGRLVQVRDAFGRSLAFQYDASHRVSQLTDPAGRAYVYSYSSTGNLTSVRYPDAALRQYHYESAAWPRALTGITDENGSRFATYEYDSAGRAIRSAQAGGAMQRTVYYYPNGVRDVIDAVGNSRRYGFALIQGVSRRVSLDNAACASCGNAVTTTGYSASGYVASLTDYRGTQTSFVRDARGLETSRTEAVGQPEARTITTAWHAGFRLPLSVTRPGQRTNYSYDASGRLTGLSLTDTATNATRSWTTTYNAQGLPASRNGPRTDVADITQYTYDAQGNLATSTNALGHQTRFTAYDAHGRLLSMVDPNGMVTTYAYDLRGRLTARNAGGQATAFVYDPAGRLLRVTRPDGSWLDHHYDAAHRLIGLVDSAGHRVVYTLDGEGRRLRQEHFDATGGSTYVRRYAYDPLGRVVQEIDAQERVQRRYTYDANGNRIVDTDALGNTTTLAFDRLDRLVRHADALGAITSYAYDPRDNLVRVTDPVGAITAYTFDGLDNRVQETSADAGASSFSFDAAGNLRQRNWPNARAVALSYDALDRPILEDYGSGVQVNYHYDGGSHGVGRLTGMTDSAGSTAWAYDPWGRVLRKNRTNGALALNTAYGYDSAGRLASLTYPSGAVLGYAYDAGGRVASMSLNGSALVSAIDWLPAGGARAWTQGNGRRVTKVFDRDAQLRTQGFESGTRTLVYDAKGRITLMTEWGVSSNYAYDAVDRLTAQSTGTQVWTWGYDGNGNRVSQSTPAGATGYSYWPGSNRLRNASGVQARDFTHDAAGNMVGDGGGSLVYDARNRLMQAPGAAFSYDGLGLRVYKSSTLTAARYYAHDLDRKPLGEYSAGAAVFETVWLGRTPIAVLKGGQRYWIDADQIDAPRVVRNQADQIVWRWRSEAFGNTAADENPSGLGVFEFNLRFPGQVFDRETGLHYNDQRDYAPWLGRYTQSDPIGLAGGINTYAYVGGNPLSYGDPTGLQVFVCNRAVDGFPFIGNHSYLYDSTTGRAEGMRGSSKSGMASNETGPVGPRNVCNKVEGSEGKEKQVMDFMQRNQNAFVWIPGMNDCHNAVGRALGANGLRNPGAPGGRMGPLSDALTPSYPSLPSMP